GSFGKRELAAFCAWCIFGGDHFCVRHFYNTLLYYLQSLLRVFLCVGPYIAFASIAIFVGEFLGGPGGQFYVVELLALCAWMDIYLAHEEMGSACNDG